MNGGDGDDGDELMTVAMMKTVLMEGEEEEKGSGLL